MAVLEAEPNPPKPVDPVPNPDDEDAGVEPNAVAPKPVIPARTHRT